MRKHEAVKGNTAASKPVVKHTQLGFETRPEVSLKGGHLVKDATLILLMNGAGTPTQYTICRPIGTTGISPNGYVMIQSEHVDTYLKATVNPYEKAAKQITDKARDQFFVRNKFYTEREGEYLWKDVLVKDIFREASRAREEAEKEAKKDFYKAEAKAGRFPVNTPENPGKGTHAKTAHKYVDKTPKVIEFTRTDFLDGYKKTDDLWKKSAEFAESKGASAALLSKYVTRGGPDGTTPQRELKWLEGVSPDRVKAYMIRYLYEPDTVLREIAQQRALLEGGGA